MREDLMNKIADPGSRIEDAVEFFGWPRELVEMMFKHSKQYFEGPWARYYPDYVYEYYAAGLYAIRQLSYSKEDIFTEDIRIFLDEVAGSCLDFACGVGDYAMYLAMTGREVCVVEHRVIPMSFLEFRFKKYGLKIKIVQEGEIAPPTDYALLVSCLDHLSHPAEFAEIVCGLTRKKIYATPCIDETYDRPTHIKEILKDVPKAFEIIRQHNLKIDEGTH